VSERPSELFSMCVRGCVSLRLGLRLWVALLRLACLLSGGSVRAPRGMSPLFQKKTRIHWGINAFRSGLQLPMGRKQRFAREIHTSQTKPKKVTRSAMGSSFLPNRCCISRTCAGSRPCGDTSYHKVQKYFALN